MENGYLYVYLSNASLKPVNFDNLHLQTIEGAMLEENHYYPYGMLIESLSARSAGKKTNLKYQSREWITELELNQYDFDLRQYDPATARWSATDPYMQFSNPYIAMANNPVLLTDPDGGKVDGSRLKAPIPEIPRDSKGRMIDDEHGGGGYSKWGNPRYSGGYIDELGHPLPDSYVMAMVGQGNIEWTSEIGNSCGFDELRALSDGVRELKAAGFDVNYNSASKNFMASKDEVVGFDYMIYHSSQLEEEGKVFGIIATERTERQSFTIGGNYSRIDELQTGLDIAGIIDPFGIVDLTNALIYAGRGKWGDAGISALAMVPYIGDLGKAGRLAGKTIQRTAKVRTAEKGLELGERFLREGYTEIAPGVFRSSDGLRQFRITDADILHSTPHFNFEIYAPNNLNNPIMNYHMPIR